MLPPCGDVMRVEVHFYGFVRDIVGDSGLSLEAGETTKLGDLLNALIERFGEGLRERLLNERGELEPSVRIFVGTDQARSLEEPLGDRDVKIYVLSGSAGG